MNTLRNSRLKVAEKLWVQVEPDFGPSAGIKVIDTHTRGWCLSDSDKLSLRFFFQYDWDPNENAAYLGAFYIKFLPGTDRVEKFSAMNLGDGSQIWFRSQPVLGPGAGAQ